MVKFRDGVLGNLVANMRLPIVYALLYPGVVAQPAS